jgi:phage-related protein (TIGR01555 family)
MLAEETKITTGLARIEKKNQTLTPGSILHPTRVNDSFQNFAAALGMQTSNLMAQSTYGFNPITRIRTLLEWIHRGSWIGGVAIDIVADDMTKAGVDFKGEIEPDDIEKINEEAVNLGVWNSVNDTIKWSRLYGGALGVLLVEGQNLATPFRVETVGRGQFRGILAMDRWQVEPSLENLVQDWGPHFGLPMYYRVTQDAPALFGQRIHYTRCMRLEGIRLPYWQRVMENLWGISVLERLYDRMVAFDSATTGMAQLAYKAYLRTIKIKGLRNIVAASGSLNYRGLIKQVEFMRLTQTNEGITMLDGDDEFEGLQNTTFTGIGDVVMHLGEQLAGATGIPLTRLFGQAPAGLNATGESDMQIYEGGIHQQQERHVRAPMTMAYRCIAQSIGVKLPKGFGLKFKPLRQLTPETKASVAKDNIEAITALASGGYISDKTTLKEVKQQSSVTDVGTNITNEDIEKASDVPVPPAELAMDPDGDEEGAAPKPPKKPATGDSLEKLSQQEAGYVDKSTKATHCGICRRFQKPNGCRLVEGVIKAEGGCLFYLKPAQ